MARFATLDAMTIQRITANLPRELLEEAQEATGRGITETLVQGLKMIQQSGAYRLAKNLKGKLDLSIDLDESRERTGR